MARAAAFSGPRESRAARAARKARYRAESQAYAPVRQFSHEEMMRAAAQGYGRTLPGKKPRKPRKKSASHEEMMRAAAQGYGRTLPGTKPRKKPRKAAKPKAKPRKAPKPKKPRKPKKACLPKRPKPRKPKKPKCAPKHRKAAKPKKRPKHGTTVRHSGPHGGIRVGPHAGGPKCSICGKPHGLREHNSHKHGPHNWETRTQHSYKGLARPPKNVKKFLKRAGGGPKSVAQALELQKAIRAIKGKKR